MFIPVFPCICWSVAVHLLYHVVSYTVLLPVLNMLIRCGLLSRQIVDRACICYLSLSSIFLLRSKFTSIVTLGLVLPLFQFLFLGLPSSARGTCLPH
jgi:hypothetical protein